MYRYLDEITGDAEFIARAKTLDELLIECARAMVGIMYDRDALVAEGEIKLTAQGKDEEELLLDWLDNILVEQDANNFFFKDFQVQIKRRDKVLIAEGKGIGQSGRPELVQAIVKAVTRHKLYVKRINEMWEARIVLDM